MNRRSNDQVSLYDLEIEANIYKSEEPKTAKQIPNTTKHIQLPAVANSKRINYYDMYYLILSTMSDLYDRKESASMHHSLELAGLHRNRTFFIIYKEIFCNGLIEIAHDDSDNFHTRPKALKKRGPKAQRYKITKKGLEYISKYIELRKVISQGLEDY